MTTRTTIKTTFDSHDGPGAVYAAAENLDLALLWLAPDDEHRRKIERIRGELRETLNSWRGAKMTVSHGQGP